MGMKREKIGCYFILLLLLIPLCVLIWRGLPEMSILFLEKGYWVRLGNSLRLTLPIVVVQPLVAVTSAYWFARHRSRTSRTLLFLYCLWALLPLQAMLLPDYLLFRGVGLLHMDLSVILPGIFAPLPVYLLAKEMAKLPPEMAEAAALDGASEWQILLFVYLPQSKTVIGIVASLAFLDSWSMTELPPVLLGSDARQPLSVWLSSADCTAPYAGSLLYSALPIAAFLFLKICKRMQKRCKSDVYCQK
jgi:multiple sugar transport system permease protein